MNRFPTVTAWDAHGVAVGEVQVPLVCMDVGANPDAGFASFDNIGKAIWTVFVLSALEVRRPRLPVAPPTPPPPVHHAPHHLSPRASMPGLHVRRHLRL
jgi:hypothetical protein